MAKSKKGQSKFTFEESITALEQLVSKMDDGKISLEEALQYFEEGISLTRHCQKILQDAQQKVFVLTQKDSMLEMEPWSEVEE